MLFTGQLLKKGGILFKLGVDLDVSFLLVLCSMKEKWG